MRESDKEFKKRVESLVSKIPKGRVMSYGQIAALCGSPLSSRIVGGIAHWGDQTLPWQRVVHKDGTLATGFPGGVEGQKQVLESEGVNVSKDYKVNIANLLWSPSV